MLGVYSGKRWALIEEHLHDVLGRQSRCGRRSVVSERGAQEPWPLLLVPAAWGRQRWPACVPGQLWQLWCGYLNLQDDILPGFRQRTTWGDSGFVTSGWILPTSTACLLLLLNYNDGYFLRREAGDWLGAVQHYMSMVLCPANSLFCQRAYLAQFLDMLRTAQAQLVRRAGWLARAESWVSAHGVCSPDPGILLSFSLSLGNLHATAHLTLSAQRVPFLP